MEECLPDYDEGGGGEEWRNGVMEDWSNGGVEEWLGGWLNLKSAL